ncbi:hypothetical protein NNC19_06245 [Clostridium sp. SHJSY1]|nr:hypothetical protein [Clostridium sp. SHJSY1]
MENKYVYREHLRKPSKFFLLVASMIIVPYFIIALEMTLTVNLRDTIGAGVIFFFVGIVLVIIIGIEFLLIYLIMYRRFKKIYVILTEEGIIYNNAKGEIRIPYESITSIKFASVKYTGGWVKIIHNNGKIRLTVVLEDIGEMVKNLKDKIDERNITNIYKDKSIFNFIKTAKYTDHSWERVYEHLKKFVVAVLVNLGVGAIAVAFSDEIFPKFFIPMLAIVGPLLTFVVTEIIFAIKLSRGVSKEKFYIPGRDKEFEAKIYKLLFGIYFIIFFIIMIIV